MGIEYKFKYTNIFILYQNKLYVKNKIKIII